MLLSTTIAALAVFLECPSTKYKWLIIEVQDKATPADVSKRTNSWWSGLKLGYNPIYGGSQ